MKKLFAIIIVLTLVFASCPTDDNNKNGNSDVIDVWTGSYATTDTIFNSTITLDIADGTWVLIENYYYTNGNRGGTNTYNGAWTRDANTLEFTFIDPYEYRSTFATASLSEGKLFFVWKIWKIVRNYTLTKKAETPPNTTFLKIKNESFIEITDVIWNNVSFTGSQNSIKTGTSMTKTVQAGSGYIYFKRQGDSIAVRTSDLVVVEEDTEKEFVFTNNTLIAETSNPDNTGTLETFYTQP